MSSIVIAGDSSGSVTLDAPAVAGTTVLTLPTTSGTLVTTAGAAQLTTSGNLTFTGTGNRITGDFSNATVANRVLIQTSTTNGNTLIGALPNGTGTATVISLFSKSDIANSSVAQLRIDDGSSVVIASTNAGGTGGNLPITFSLGGVERLRIDASGNVGIGTSSPTGRLDVATGNSFFTGLRLNGSNITDTIYLATGEMGISTGSASAIKFNTNSAERMRITSGGDVFVGNTTGSFSTVNGALIGATGRFLGTCTNDATIAGSRLGSDGNVAAWYRGVTLVGQISVTASSCSFTNLSDYRVKENVTPLTNALSKVSKLKPCTYTFTLDGAAGEGFIAHELAEVVPQAVTGEKDAVDAEGKPVYQGIDTSFLVATLTAAIQEQQALITQLQADVAALKGAK